MFKRVEFFRRGRIVVGEGGPDGLDKKRARAVSRGMETHNIPYDVALALERWGPDHPNFFAVVEHYYGKDRSNWPDFRSPIPSGAARAAGEKD